MRFYRALRTLVNPFGIRLVDNAIHDPLFGGKKYSVENSEKKVQKALDHLNSFGLKPNVCEKPDDALKGYRLPQIYGDIEHHFYQIAKDSINPYLQLLETLTSLDRIPKRPGNWVISEPGWFRYDGASHERVDRPLEDVFTFDVEVCVKSGDFPVIATALSPEAWYSWISSHLLNGTVPEALSTEDMIPVDAADGRERAIIGHNVSYDRARCKEQYDLKVSGTRFVDTMSLHIAVSGMTSEQRSVKAKTESGEGATPLWTLETSRNNLQDVYKLYCGPDAEPLKKSTRDVFVNGTFEDILEDLQNLMTYCANDVLATHNVVVKLFPMFQARCTHPATLAGMFEMCLSYLPVNSNWNHYLNQADDAAAELEGEIQRTLCQQAKESMQLLTCGIHRKDLWLWDQDWTPKNLKVKVQKGPRKTDGDLCYRIMSTQTKLYKKQPLCPGYPAWYSEICTKSHLDGFAEPSDLSASKKVVPKLLRLCWNGYPLHRDEHEKWGYVEPVDSYQVDEIGDAAIFPAGSLLKFLGRFTNEELTEDFEPRPVSNKKKKYPNEHDGISLPELPGCIFHRLPHKDGKELRVGNPLSKSFLEKIKGGVLATESGGLAEKVLKGSKAMSYWRSNQDRIKRQMVVHVGPGDHSAIVPMIVPAGTLTRRAVERTWLTASNAKEDRIGSELKSLVQAPSGYSFVGADVDSQELWIAAVIGDSYFTGLHGSTALGWMTLQGSKADGTDMHSKVAKSVGVTRDQAKILNYGRLYGAGVPFAKQLLLSFNPTLSEHEASRLADKMYGETKGTRSYVLNNLGAFCYALSTGRPETFKDCVGLEVNRKEMSILIHTKRKMDEYITYNRKTPWNFEVNEDGEDLAYELECEELIFNKADELEKRVASLSKFLRLIRKVPKSKELSWTIEAKSCSERTMWQGGTESSTFNRLEEIALQWKPKTPVLGCQISRVLESEKVGIDYLPSRINWVVQSSAVDYLHLLLVAMRWQMKQSGLLDHGRFVISIHDEVRYMIKSEYKYEAAMALQTANLMVRAMFCSRLGMEGLPEDVAFFSSVDIDSVMRKEPHIECVTPSNPQGLSHGYGILPGESLTVQDLLLKMQQ